ncbi:hypothetical protein [Streptomyces longwoodensis]|uniref:hypothetical protein n=1 Tax=Streptomyces longwoodensis TaxID=68231 RepID=UPI0034078907
MRTPVYKSRDTQNVRVYADEVRPGVWTFTRTQTGADGTAYELSGDEAAAELARYRAADSFSFYRYFGAGSLTGTPSEHESPTTEHHIAAREILAGDTFTLHAHERTALRDAWPVVRRGHVYVEFVGGGGATLPADRPVTVTRTVDASCATA